MQFRILGPLEVSVDGQALEISGHKARQLLALLLINANEVVSTDRILEALWGEEGGGKQNALWVHVSKLRSVLDAGAAASSGGLIETCAPGYRLNADPECIDAVRFERSLEAPLALLESEPVAASLGFKGALESWRGDPLAEFAYDDFAQPEIRRLTEVHLSALHGWIEAELLGGRHRELIPELHALVEAHPQVESLALQLMLALYRSGRQTESLRIYEDARLRLLESSGLDPSPQLTKLRDEILRHNGALDLVVAAVKSLPARSSALIGRQDEIAALCTTVSDKRLVTVVGPAGVGKTSVAIEAARQSQRGFPGGVAFVALSGASSLSDVEDAVLTSVGSSSQGHRSARDAIRSKIGQSKVLVVLDTCEHLVDAVSLLVNWLLATCEGMSVLATSRTRLRADGESVYLLQPLPTEADDGPSAAASYLAQRIQGEYPTTTFTEDDRLAIQLISHQLDGIPLALEMVAARSTWFGLPDLAARMQKGESVLDDPTRAHSHPHQSLRRAVEWSIDLLSDEARRAFLALSVFPSGFTRESAADLVQRLDIASSGDRLLVELLEASLVAIDRRVDDRYLMLDTIRAVGRQLAATELGNDGLRAFVELTIDELGETELGFALLSSDPQDRGESIGFASDAVIEHFPELRLQLASAAAPWHWHLLSRDQGYRALRELTSDITIPEDSIGLSITRWLAMHATYAGDLDDAEQWVTSADRIAASMGSGADRIMALKPRSLLEARRGNVELAIQLNEEALALQTNSHDALWILANIAEWASFSGDVELLDTTVERFEVLLADERDPSLAARPLMWRCVAALQRGDLPSAVEWVSRFLGATPPDSFEHAFALNARVGIHVLRLDVEAATQDLVALEESSHLDDAPWSFQLGAHIVAARAGVQRIRGELRSAATVLSSGLERVLPAVEVFESRAETIPHMLVESVFTLDALGQSASARAIWAPLRDMLGAMGRALPQPVATMLDGVAPPETLPRGDDLGDLADLARFAVSALDSARDSTDA